VGSAVVCTLLHAQRSDSDQPKHKSSASASASPDESPSPARSPRPKPTPRKSTKKKHAAKEEQTPKPKKKKKPTPAPEKTPKKSTSPKPSETPVAHPAIPTPRGTAAPNPAPPPAPRPTVSSNAAATQEPEQLTIEKYGYEKRQGFWARLFGGGSSRQTSGAGYRYLSGYVRTAIDRAPVAPARWQFIVVHNSGTRQGNAAAFDYYHRHVRRMRNGLAYHFVIGNGTSTGNGQIEVGDRWRRQINGGHVHSDYLNNIALGICLVGDFNRDQPTRAQLESCEELIRYLRQRCGKVGDHYPIVKPHRAINPPRWPTDCPGDVFPYSWFRRF
jgi:hypothetical protein